jgi:hypothetical protein
MVASLQRLIFGLATRGYLDAPAMRNGGEGDACGGAGGVFPALSVERPPFAILSGHDILRT